ncbi:hypothetical protein HYH03_004258 [Edaphochlamys debaryana]|uniref:Sulfatase N-terminal domain-containing protein n=1 Tax=Edaphochlamys debaryana TaxID=47281 RepID=A0A835YA81_9CHLO|nr:hypothetical protein HYH03_004258 [Edaphochlamys debaryana]|eukprot:KAG2497999.1 hypothetical protein HYH03_004258 [Edaphochlamys debaryana]
MCGRGCPAPPSSPSPPSSPRFPSPVRSRGRGAAVERSPPSAPPSEPGAPPVPLAPSTRNPRKPNFLIIMTDDQDQLLNSTHRAYMPLLNSLIADEGLQLRNFAISTSTCCPSRTSLLTGLFTHNHDITSNLGPYGGYSKFQQLNLDVRDTWLPTQLQSAGYSTYLVGKFLNEFDAGPGQRCPRGFDVLDALVEPYIYTYWGPAFSKNCGPLEQFGFNDYSTDLIRDKTLQYIREAATKDQPFFMQVAPIAPHVRCNGHNQEDSGKSCDNPLPATRHKKRFQDIPLPSSANLFQPLPEEFRSRLIDNDWQLAEGERKETKLSGTYRMRQRSLLAVDEMLGDIVNELYAQNMLDDTYIIYTSDNGYHLGNHDSNQGKVFPWEEDIRVPFFIRGPGIPRGVVSDYQTTMVDVPATVLALAGAEVPGSWDGYPIPFHRIMPDTYTPRLSAAPYDFSVPGASGPYIRDAQPIEMWIYKPGAACNMLNYRSVRVCTSYLAFGSPSAYRAAFIAASRDGTQRGSTIGLGNLLFSAAERTIAGDSMGTDLAAVAAAGGGQGTTGTCYKYTSWCWGGKELYDLALDPAEIDSRIDDPRAARLVGRLDAMMAVIGHCRGDRCREAYSAIVGEKGVLNLEELMDPKYDNVFDRLPRLAFRSCSPENRNDEYTWYQ